MDIKVVSLPSGQNQPLPTYETSGSAAMDVRAAIPDPVELAPGKFRLIPLGFAIELPQGLEAQIRARSGLAAKKGIGLVNGIGTIDSDYRGEVGAILINHGEETFTIQPGDRVAQMVIAPVSQVRLVPVDALDASDRTGGFGSTGTR